MERLSTHSPHLGLPSRPIPYTIIDLVSTDGESLVIWYTYTQTNLSKLYYYTLMPPTTSMCVCIQFKVLKHYNIYNPPEPMIDTTHPQLNLLDSTYSDILFQVHKILHQPKSCKQTISFPPTSVTFHTLILETVKSISICSHNNCSNALFFFFNFISIFILF